MLQTKTPGFQLLHAHHNKYVLTHAKLHQYSRILEVDTGRVRATMDSGSGREACVRRAQLGVDDFC